MDFKSACSFCAEDFESTDLYSTEYLAATDSCSARDFEAID
jgi:hypothetical protein